MGHVYEASAVSSVAPAIGTPFFEIRNSSSSTLEILEIGVSLGAATATNVALYRSTAQGVGGAGLLTGRTLDPRSRAASASVAANAFTTAPTFVATDMLRRFHLPAAIGAGLIWAWNPGELVLAVSTSLVLVTPTIAGAAAISSYAKWTE